MSALKLYLLVQVLGLHCWDYWLYVTSEHLIISSNTQRLHSEGFTSAPSQFSGTASLSISNRSVYQKTSDLSVFSVHPHTVEDLFCGINRSLYLTVEFSFVHISVYVWFQKCFFAGNDRCSYTDRSVPCTHCFCGELHLCVTHPVLSVYES